MAGEFQAGAASVSISPDDPRRMKVTALHGLAPIEGVLEGYELFADAAAFRAGDRTAIVATFDTGGARADLRKAISERTKVEERCVLLAGRHNHSAGGSPADENDPKCLEAVDRYRQKVREGIVEACARAVEDLRPSEIAAGSATLRQPVGQNRRMRHGFGGCTPRWGCGPVAIPGEKFGPAPGPDSPRIDFLCARRLGEKKPFAVITSYPSHIHLGATPYFNSELPGGVKRGFRRLLGEVTVVYGTATGGDLDLHGTFPPPGGKDAFLKWYRDSLDLLGGRLAEAVCSAIPGEGWARPAALREEFFTTEGQDPRVARMYRISALRMGNVALAGIPAELFMEHVERIRAASPVPHLLLMGFNGSGRLFYIGTPLSYEQGGYETGKGPAPSPEEERRMLEAGKRDMYIGTARLDTGEELVRRIAEVLGRVAKD